MNLTYIRNEIKKQIKNNPVNIVIKRVNWIDDGMGGRYQDGEVEVELTASLYKKGYKTKTDDTKEAGIIFNEETKLLAEWDADILKEDTFIADDKTYKITDIEAKKLRGAVTHKEAQLERVR